MDPPMVASLCPAEPASVPVETTENPAFAEVYAQYFRAMWRALRRLGVEPSGLDDAVQDVFVVVHRRLAEFDGRSLRAWLYAIAVRVASDHRRSASHRRT